jgi:hypothetical protein
MKINQAVIFKFLSLADFLYYTLLVNFSLSNEMGRHKMMN